MRDPQKQILILCYNRSLEAYLRTQIEMDSSSHNIKVWTFQRWAEQQTGLSCDWGREEFEHYEQRLTEGILA